MQVACYHSKAITHKEAIIQRYNVYETKKRRKKK